MKKVKIGENSPKKLSFDKSFDEKENEILTPIVSDVIQVSSQPRKYVPNDAFDITSAQLENLVSLYTDEHNKQLLFQNLELLGGTKGILSKLRTSSENGIESPRFRKEEFGINKIFEEPPAPFIKFLKESLSELMIIILLSAAIIQIIIGLSIGNNKKTGWLDGASVLFAVFVVVSVESFTNWQKEKKFYELNNLKNAGTVFKTIRDKNIKDLKADDLLVGDIIIISGGETIPADCLLLEGNGIKIDESSLTGESKLVSKEIYEDCETNKEIKIMTPIILSGTDVIKGNGKALIICVGERSTKGKIRRMVDNSKDEKITPLQEKLDVLAKKISTFAIFAGIATFVCLTINLIYLYISDYKLFHGLRGAAHAWGSKKQAQSEQHEHHDQKMDRFHPKVYLFPKILENIMITTVIITIALPEGLPMAVALTLAFSIKKLMDQNNLVRKMHSCETMGGADYILTDKTGTLTTNELNVVKILTQKGEITLEDEKLEEGVCIADKIREDHQKYFENDTFWNLLRTALSVNVDCIINFLEKPDINGDLEECESKNKTDTALINFLYRVKSPISEINNKYKKEDKKQIPFDSYKKRMTTFIKENDDTFKLYTKGGAENIKKFCKYYIDPETGEKRELTNKDMKNLEEKIQNCNKDMLRTIYICYKEISENDFNEEDENIDTNNLVLLAIFGIRDIIRKGVREAVLKCKQASINVIMVTGDNIQTAHAIAKECNIISPNCSLVSDEESIEDYLQDPPVEINGDIFYDIIGGLVCSTCDLPSNECKCPKTNAEAEQISKKLNLPIQKLKNDTIKNIENFKKITKNLKIMARSKPIHKYALVVGLKELNYIVAVTGDGTNDAPALSKCDIGFSMFNGTDIAKNSSDIILMNNNFSSIVSAIKYGRNIIDNLRKFIQFQLVINLTICSFIVICSCIGSETPIKSIQMLWIDLIMDSLATLTLTTELPHDGLLLRKPTKRNENIITKNMIKHVTLQTILQFSILMFIYLFGPKFIQEQDLSRIAENEIINKCFGILPGDMTDTNKIIYGVKNFWHNHVPIKSEMMNNAMCKEYIEYGNLSAAFKLYNQRQGSPVQLTMIFNIFVLYTLFNQINCRVVDGSKNIFARLKNNPLFIIIEIFEFIVQFIIVEYWNVVFKASKNGLTCHQWGICIILSLSTLILDFILKL